MPAHTAAERTRGLPSGVMTGDPQTDPNLVAAAGGQGETGISVLGLNVPSVELLGFTIRPAFVIAGGIAAAVLVAMAVQMQRRPKAGPLARLLGR